MQSERQCEDAWWAGVVVIGGVFSVLSSCCLPLLLPPFWLFCEGKSILLGCPLRLVQQTGAKGTLVSDFFFCFCDWEW